MVVFISNHKIILKKIDSGGMFIVKLNVHQGFQPRHLELPPKYNNPQTGNTLLSQSAGAVWGTGTAPSVFLPVLRLSWQIKGILQRLKIVSLPFTE
jgi:hypothetical protein